MSKKKIVGISIATILILSIAWFFCGFIYGNPLVFIAISKDAHRYMEEKYHEKIVVEQTVFDEIYFGYSVKGHFVAIPDFKFELFASDSKIVGDNCIESYWNYELDTMLGQDIKNSFGCKYDISFGTLCCVGYTGENPYDITKMPKFYDCWDDIKGEAGITIELDTNYIEGASDEEILNFSRAMLNKVAIPDGYLNTCVIEFKNNVGIGIDAEKATDLEYIKSNVHIRADDGSWVNYY